jgi:ribonuclease HI
MIQIYTDGAVSKNPGPGGSALILVKDEEIIYEKMYSFPHITNNYCELFAVLKSIEHILNNDISECKIYSDSKYAVDGINLWMSKWVLNDWKGSNNHPIKNIELWKDLYTLWNEVAEKSNMSIHHVFGHRDNKWNNYVDKLAQTSYKNKK